MKTNNKLNKIRSKAKDVCVWIVIGLVIGCIVGWSTHTAIYNITHKEPEVSVGYVIAQHYHVLLDELMEEHHES